MLLEPTTTVWSFELGALGASIGTSVTLAVDIYEVDSRRLPASYYTSCHQGNCGKLREKHGH